MSSRQRHQLSGASMQKQTQKQTLSRFIYLATKTRQRAGKPSKDKQPSTGRNNKTHEGTKKEATILWPQKEKQIKETQINSWQEKNLATSRHKDQIWTGKHGKTLWQRMTKTQTTYTDTDRRMGNRWVGHGGVSGVIGGGDTDDRWGRGQGAHGKAKQTQVTFKSRADPDNTMLMSC